MTSGWMTETCMRKSMVLSMLLLMPHRFQVQKWIFRPQFSPEPSGHYRPNPAFSIQTNPITTKTHHFLFDKTHQEVSVWIIKVFHGPVFYYYLFILFFLSFHQVKSLFCCNDERTHSPAVLYTQQAGAHNTAQISHVVHDYCLKWCSIDWSKNLD